jgi:hypothetical protein
MVPQKSMYLGYYQGPYQIGLLEVKAWPVAREAIILSIIPKEAPHTNILLIFIIFNYYISNKI